MSDVREDLAVLARALRRARETKPGTVGEAMTAYAKELDATSTETPGVKLLVAELVWLAIRPEKKPVADALGAMLERRWTRYDQDSAILLGRYGARR